MKISGQESVISGAKEENGKKKERIRMAMYWTCPLCGANLDPGEHCDCKEKVKEDKRLRSEGNAGKEPEERKASGSAA